MLSILIGRGTWPDVFLTGISNQITQTEGAAGTSYWGSDAYPVYDPGFDMPDGSGPAVVNDPMYGVFMAAAINNPAWIIHTYTGHDTTDVIWDNPGYNGSSFDPNKPAHAQVDQSLYDLFKTRGLDAASCAAFLLACGAADATTMSGTPPDGWTPSSTQAIELSLSLKRDGRLYDNKSWWDKYGHQVLGMAAMYFGFVSFVTPIGWAALVFGVASMAAMAGDAVLSFTEGDWVAGLTTLGLLIIVPLVVGKVIRWVSLPVGAAQGLTEAQLARVFAGEIVEDSFGNRFVLLGNKVTAFTKDEWALLETSGVLSRDGTWIVLSGGKVLTLSDDEWCLLQTGGVVTRDGMTFRLIVKGPITQAEYDAYLADLNTRPANYGSPDARQYQIDQLGPTEYEIGTPKGSIWADNIHYDPTTGAVIADAKFVDKPGASFYEGTDSLPAKIRPRIWQRSFDNEIERYAAAILDPNNPITRLDIITSTPAAQANISARILYLENLWGIYFPFTVTYVV